MSPTGVESRPAVGRGGRTSPALWPALAVAMLFPTFLSWVDFVVLANRGAGPNPAQQLAYATGKAVQFSFPVLCLWLFERRLPRPARPTTRGLGLGLAFGLSVAAGMIGLYFLLLRDAPLFAQMRVELRQKLTEFNLTTPFAFFAFAAFLTLLHSLLEEYYFRWFLFGWLKRQVPLAVAVVLSSLAFMGHHVVVLGVYLPGHVLTGVLPFSLCVGVGGAVWAWLYHRSGSLYAPWLSHAVVDAAMFVIGYDLVFVRGSP